MLSQRCRESQGDKISRTIFTILDVTCASLEQPGSIQLHNCISTVESLSLRDRAPVGHLASSVVGWGTRGQEWATHGLFQRRWSAGRVKASARCATQDAIRDLGKMGFGNSDPFLGSPVTETGSPHRQVTRAAEGWSVVSFLRIWALTVTSLCLALVLVSSLLRSMRGNQAVLQAPQSVLLLVWAQKTPGGRRDSCFAFGGNN